MIKALGGGNSQGKIVNQANRIPPGKCREYEDQSGMRVRLGSGTGKCCPVLFVQRCKTGWKASERERKYRMRDLQGSR